MLQPDQVLLLQDAQIGAVPHIEIRNPLLRGLSGLANSLDDMSRKIWIDGHESRSLGLGI
jgi:hypothetical protein